MYIGQRADSTRPFNTSPGPTTAVDPRGTRRAMPASADWNALRGGSLVGPTQGVADGFGPSVNEVHFCIMYSLFGLTASPGFYLYDT